ncbi:hypothetical protein ABPG75_006672 [Micractinium tetrahymenae]
MAGSLAALLAAAQSQPWHIKLAGLAAYTLASAFALRAGSAAVAGPTRRLALALLCVAGNAAVPLLFHRTREGVSVAFSAFILTWLASFKALALAVGRGPLAQQRWRPLQFWALYALPLVPAAPPTAAAPRRRPSRLKLGGPGEPAHLLLRWLAKAAVTAGVVFCLLLEVPPFARTCLYVLGIYSMLGVVMDGPAALVLRPLRLDLAPHFLPPWESASLAEFWGSRWNQAAGSSLRTTIYDPIVEGSLVDWQQLATLTVSSSAGGSSSANGNRGRRRSARLAAAAAKEAAAAQGGGLAGARLAGMAACFLASGAVHELIFWYVEGHVTAQLAWLLFFIGQVPLILGERWLLGQLKAAGVRLPELARQALTLGVLLATSHRWFFQPAEAAGLPALFAASMRESYAALVALPLRLLGGTA